MRLTLIAVLLTAASFGGAGCSSTPKTTEERGKEAVTLYKDGVQQFNDGKIDAGIQELKKANDLQPGYTLLRYDLGRMLLVRAERAEIASMQLKERAKSDHQEGKHEDARKKEEEATNLNRSARVDWGEAQGHFLWVQDVWPYEPNVPYFLSIVATGLSDFKAAKKYLKRAKELGNPTGPQLEKIERALELLEKAELEQERLGQK